MYLTKEKIKKLEHLWFVFGNNGKLHTHGNHKFIQEFLTDTKPGDSVGVLFEENINFYGGNTRVGTFEPLTKECIRKVREILEGE